MFRWAVCFEGSVTGVNATDTGNEVSQPTLEFTPLDISEGERTRAFETAFHFMKCVMSLLSDLTSSSVE